MARPSKLVVMAGLDRVATPKSRRLIIFGVSVASPASVSSVSRLALLDALESRANFLQQMSPHGRRLVESSTLEVWPQSTPVISLARGHHWRS